MSPTVKTAPPAPAPPAPSEPANRTVSRPRRRGVSRRATAAIWVACLAGGVAVGVLTDGGIVVSGRPDRAEPASEGTNVDAAGWTARAGSEASVRTDPSGAAADASDVRADGDRAAVDGSGDPPAGGTSARSPRRSGAGGLDGRDAESILEAIVPGVVIPPLDGQPGQSTTTTTEPASTTTTTSEPPTTTTSSVPTVPGGGSGPVITPLPPVRNP
jgi:hypothetical protein